MSKGGVTQKDTGPVSQQSRVHERNLLEWMESRLVVFDLNVLYKIQERKDNEHMVIQQVPKLHDIPL